MCKAVPGAMVQVGLLSTFKLACCTFFVGLVEGRLFGFVIIGHQSKSWLLLSLKSKACFQ
jgi:hypothetical protein